jgi:hypothetical protein
MLNHSAMFDEDWAKNQAPASGLSTTTRSDEEEVDQLMGDDSPSYDLGWAALPAEDQAGKCFFQYILISPIDDYEDDGPAYDLGWAALPAEDQAGKFCFQYILIYPIDIYEDDGPAYDLGWATVPDEEAAGEYYVHLYLLSH